MNTGDEVIEIYLFDMLQTVECIIDDDHGSRAHIKYTMHNPLKNWRSRKAGKIILFKLYYIHHRLLWPLPAGLPGTRREGDSLRIAARPGGLEPPGRCTRCRRRRRGKRGGPSVEVVFTSPGPCRGVMYVIYQQRLVKPHAQQQRYHPHNHHHRRAGR